MISWGGVGGGLITFVVDCKQDGGYLGGVRGVANHVRCSSVAGTQTMDRCWKNLKTWMGVGYSVSDNKVGDRFMSESIPPLV